MPTLVLSQREWRVEDPLADTMAPLAAAKAAAARRQLEPAPVLIVMPQATRPAAEVPTESAMLAQAGALAVGAGAWLAGSAWVRAGERPAADAAPSIVAFLVGDDGRVRLRADKITPELVNGFADGTSALGRPAPFAVAATPFGQVGLLPGEDILYTPYARSLVLHGAELILNPSLERSDDLFEPRQAARFARAGDNACYVAVSSPSSLSASDTSLALPPATALYDPAGAPVAARGTEDFLFPDYDLQALRRIRVNPQRSYPVIVRANTYAHGYARAATASRAAGQLRPAPGTAEAWREEARRRQAERALPPSRHAKIEQQYEALLVQECPRLIPLDRSIDARAIMLKNLDESLELAGSRANIPSVRVCVFPEFWLTGPGGIGGVSRTVDDMARLALTYPDPIFDRISEFAQRHKVYMAFQNFEIHPKLPGRVFNSAFLIDDSGNLVHTYRKNQCADVWGLLPDTTPGSVLSQYLDVFGTDALFPVADTPLGRLANMICFDNMIPEVAHGLRRAGAEVILHSTSEPHGGAGREVWDTGRRMRAFENTVYLLSALEGGEHQTHDSDTYTFFRRGHSRIVRFDGRVEGTVDGPGPVAFRVNVDLGALRRARANPFINYALWDDPAVYADVYAGDVGLPNDLWAGDPQVNPYLGAAQIRRRIDDYLSRSIYVAPGVAPTRATIPDAV
jgi:predicted amidohydrolase